MLQKHHKIVFGVLLVAIIIAFVFTIGSVPFFGDSYTSYVGERIKKDFHGYDLTDDNVTGYYRTCAVYEVMLDGGMLQSNEQLEMFMLRQMYLAALAKDLGLRQVTEGELLEYLHSRPVFRNADGSFNDAAWKSFKDERLGSGRMTDEQLTAIIAQNALIEKVSKLLGGPGYILPAQIEREYKLLKGKWDLLVGVLDYEDFKPAIKADPAEIKKFYDTNSQAYRVGEGLDIEAVFIPMKDFASKVPAPKDEDLQVFYGANMNRYAETKDGKTQIPPFAKVKGKVLGDYLTDATQTMLKQAGEDIVMAVYESGAKMNSAEFRKVLSDMKVSPKKVGALRITDEKLPEGLPAQIAAAALRLTPDQFYSDPILLDDGVWIVFMTKSLDPYLPSFDQVKEKVGKDYLESQRRKMFFDKAKAMVSSMRTAASSGKSVSDAVKSSGGDVIDLKGFSLSKPEGKGIEIYSVLRDQLPKMKAGSVSDSQTLSGKTYVVYASKLEQPVAKADSDELSKLAKDAKQNMSTISSSSVVGSEISAHKAQEKEDQ